MDNKVGGDVINMTSRGLDLIIFRWSGKRPSAVCFYIGLFNQVIIVSRYDAAGPHHRNAPG